MKFSDYIRDRAAYIGVYFLSTALIILIMSLSFTINELEVQKSNIIYALIVSSVLFLVLLGYDYYKNRNFHEQLVSILNSEEDLDYILNIGMPKSSEQELFKKVLLKAYKLSGDKTIRYEELQKQYIYFINQWVHQMKTPVSVINLMLQDAAGEENKSVFESIAEENEKLAHGLDMMLYNARLNEFNLDFNVESLEITAVVRKVINENKKAIIRNRLYPKIVSNADILVETDRKWISFVINQIVVNAIKYSRANQLENKSIIINIEEQASRVVLSISDEGIGIPKEDLSRVFNAFFTGKNGRKTEESTGMGMYLAKRVCDKLGHELLVDSEEGKGTTFSIVFYRGKNLFKL
jgi:signal transduction histidine kinase